MLQLLDRADSVRRKVAPQTAQKHKAALGQYMTPTSTAMFMASLFFESKNLNSRLLDAGAGVGALSCAFLERWLAGGFNLKKVDLVAYEVDPVLRKHLNKMVEIYSDGSSFKATVLGDDFISHSVEQRKIAPTPYTHAILNPPYRKINSDSHHRLSLRSVGIETVNLYSAFVALAITQLAKGGQLVAIIPRSFCNGPYYKSFRELIFANCSIHRIHLFESRSDAFKDDGVLQENIIIHLVRDEKQGGVVVSTSTDDSFDDLKINNYSFDEIVSPRDSEKFIHVPTTKKKNVYDVSTAINESLSGLGLKVSTGPVVDYRVKDQLRAMPEKNSVPLLYPAHFGEISIEWPQIGIKKPNAILLNKETEKSLYPNGFYCVVKRFSSKEEKRRLVACLVDPASFSETKLIGIENHLNVFNIDRGPLPELLARGLCVYLNSSAVDESFRKFSGHTQVNATDLKQMRYPNRDILIELGKWYQKRRKVTQQMIDEQVNSLVVG